MSDIALPIRKRKRDGTEEDGAERRQKRKAKKEERRLARHPELAAKKDDIITTEAQAPSSNGRPGRQAREGSGAGERTKNALRKRRRKDAKQLARRSSEDPNSQTAEGALSGGKEKASANKSNGETGKDSGRAGRGDERRTLPGGGEVPRPTIEEKLARRAERRARKSARRKAHKAFGSKGFVQDAARSFNTDQRVAKAEREAEEETAQDAIPAVVGNTETETERRRRRRDIRPAASADHPISNVDDGDGALVPTGDAVEVPEEKPHLCKEEHSREAKRLRNARNTERKLMKAQNRERQALLDASWTVSEPVGGKYLDVAPLFANDEQHLLFATEYAMSAYAIATSTLECSLLSDSTGQIISYTLAPSDPSLAFVGTEQGYILSWNWSEGNSIGHWHVGGQIYGLGAARFSDLEQDTVFTVNKAKNWLITAHRFNANDTEPRILANYQKSIRSLQVLNQGRFLVAMMPDGLLLGRLTHSGRRLSDLKYEWREVPCRQAPTCFDARSNPKRREDSGEDIDVVYGGIGGAIYFYRNIFKVLHDIDHPQAGAKHDQPTNAVPLNWHRDAIGAVAFSRDGNYIISGGRETVLVLWQLDTGKKQFLPHLESPIQSLTVSSSGALYAVGLADNSVMVLSTAELTPTANFAGLQTPSTSMLPSQKQMLPTQEVYEQLVAGDASLDIRAVVDPTQANHLLCAVPSYQSAQAGVFPSNPPSPYLQTLMVGSDSKSTHHISRQALARTNATETNTGPEMNRLSEPNVTHMSMSRNGRWLATIDEWMPPFQDLEDLVLDPADVPGETSKLREVTLRIWQWNGPSDKVETGAWNLNSRIDSPHLLEGSRVSGRVLALVSQPDHGTFASVGEDCVVRIWAPKTRLYSNGRVFWSDIYDLELKGRKIVNVPDQKTTTWWSLLHTIPLPSAMEEESLNRRAPDRAALAYSNDSSLLVAHLHFDTTSEALVNGRVIDSHIEGSVDDNDLEQSDDDGRDGLVHFIDTDSGSIRESREPMCPMSSKLQDSTTAVLNDGIHALGFLERHLLILTRLAAFVWDVTDFSLILDIPLPQLRHTRNERQVSSSFPPPPQLAINLPTSSFAISAPVRKSNSQLKHDLDADLPPHPHREYTSRLQIYAIANQSLALDRSDAVQSRTKASYHEPLLVENLPRLSLALLSLAGDADGDINASDGRLAPSDSYDASLPVRGEDGGQETTNAALKRGYIAVDVTATVRTIRPPIYPGSTASVEMNQMREDSPHAVSAAEGNHLALTTLSLTKDVVHEDEDNADDMEIDSQAESSLPNGVNGVIGQHKPSAPRLVSEQKLAEVLEYGNILGQKRADQSDLDATARAGVLPSVRDMFEGVLDLFVRKRGTQGGS